MKRSCAVIVLIGAGLVASAREAHADLTLFLGANTTPATRQVRGAAIGLSLLVVGFEVEVASTRQKATQGAPGLGTGTVNILLQTPFPAVGIQPYLTAGGGLYRETLKGARETSFASNVGGGVKVALAGPLRARLDYRVFRLSGSPRQSRPHRIYAGLNLAF